MASSASSVLSSNLEGLSLEVRPFENSRNITLLLARKTDDSYRVRSLTNPIPDHGLLNTDFRDRPCTSRRSQLSAMQETGDVIGYVASLCVKLITTRSTTREHAWCRHSVLHLGSSRSCRITSLFIPTTGCSFHHAVPVLLQLPSINKRTAIA